MAGGGGGRSMMEAPSYVVAGVFAFFLVMSFSLEKVLHWLKHKLQECKRRGLLVALNTLITEVMLLGFISLILIAFEEEIVDICVKNHTKDNVWVLLHRVDDCAPCLADTRHISDQYKEEHQCPFWVKGDSEDAEHNEITDLHSNVSPASEYGDDSHDRRLLAGGDGGSDDGCGEDKEPLVSVEVLHETHIAIFLLAVFHVANSLIMILLATWKVSHLWGKWKQEDDKHVQMVTQQVQSAFSSLEEISFTDTASNIPKLDHTVPENREALSAVGSDSISNDPSAPRTDKARVEADFEAGVGDIKNDQDQSSKQDMPQELKRTSVLSQLGSEMLKGWIPRERNLNNYGDWTTDCLISFFKQFIKPVSQEEFKVLRASFMLTHKRTTNFNFIDYLLSALDEDFSKVVTISVFGWLVMIIFVLVKPLLDWTTWRILLIQFVAVILVLALNTKLIQVVRYVARGGQAHTLSPDIFWLKKPELLLPIIKFLLFFNSVVFAEEAFFAWQVGPKSCYFHGRDPEDGFNGADWYWVISLLINLGIFFHISFVSLPVYSLTVHMGSNWSHHIIGDAVKARMKELASKVRSRQVGSSPCQN